MTTALELPTSEFLLLVLDDDLVRTEFEEILAAEWGQSQELPAIPPRNGGSVGLTRWGRRALNRRSEAPLGSDLATVRIDGGARQRSPPTA
jgi:hypothetical protein